MVDSVLFSSKSDEWATPPDIFAALNAEFCFDLDACATDANHKLPEYFTAETDGLLQDWGGASGFLQSALFKNKRLG